MLRVGFGRTDITPELGVRLGGYGIEHRPAEAILDRLHSTALVMEQAEIKVVVLNLDWVEICEKVTAMLRRKINQATGIPEEHINISVSHTHSSPNIVSAWGWGEADQQYIDSVTGRIVESVVMADSSLQGSEAGFGSTESLVGVSRRRITEKHDFDYTADERGLFDPEMTVVRFRDNNGKEIGIVVHYGAHCTSMGPNRLVSRDWCGIMKDRIEGQFNAPVLFLNGAIGGVGPRTNVRVGENDLAAGGGDGIESVREVGYRAATDAMLALLSVKEWRHDLPLSVCVDDLTIPYAPLLSLETAEAIMKKYEPVKDQYGWNMCEYEYHKAVVEAYRKPILDSRTFKQTIITLGPLALVPFPGEVFPGITLRIKHGSPFRYTLACSITNGYWSYIHTREAIHREGIHTERPLQFEMWSCRSVNAYMPADNIDDALVEQNLKILNNTRRV